MPSQLATDSRLFPSMQGSFDPGRARTAAKKPRRHVSRIVLKLEGSQRHGRNKVDGASSIEHRIRRAHRAHRAHRRAGAHLEDRNERTKGRESLSPFSMWRGVSCRVGEETRNIAHPRNASQGKGGAATEGFSEDSVSFVVGSSYFPVSARSAKTKLIVRMEGAADCAIRRNDGRNNDGRNCVQWQATLCRYHKSSTTTIRRLML